METPVNQDLQLAFDFVRYTNRNIFLTGKAGTGKTTFLHDLKRTSPKRMVVVAPTGVAAINAGGVTIHSFFQLPFHPYIPALYFPGGTRGVEQGQDTPVGYKMSREKVSIIRSLDLLVIDEISMVRSDTLDAVDSALRRYRQHHLPFGGVQLLMIGDLQQLAPVVKEEERDLLGKYYDTPFFFGSKALGSTDYVSIELKHIYRQSDRVFIDLLNKVRDNRVDTDVINELNKRHDPAFDPDSGGGYITLTTHNSQARTLNESKLELLPGKAHSFRASVKDDFPELSYPADEELILKVGAQVMFIKNDISPEKLFFNGKIGKVRSFEGDSIVVECPGESYPIRVERAEWQNMKYSLDEETKEITETVTGVFTQYPLRLAWAITIHKSQGLTFDRAVIDAKSAFAHGQVYVALSRCRSLEGLVLSTMLTQRSIIDDPSITGFIRETEKMQPGREQLDVSRRAYERTLLSELFDFSSLERYMNNLARLLRENQESIMGDPLQQAELALASIRQELVHVSGRFALQIDGLLKTGSDAEKNEALQERVKKAAEYFLTRMEEALKIFTGDFEPETDNKAVRKAVTEALDRLNREVQLKSACLKAAGSGFSTASFLNARARAAAESPAPKAKRGKPEYDASGIGKHPALVRLLKEWRNEKAEMLGLPHYMIIQQKTIVTLASLLPQSMKELKKIKGIGKKKAESYGAELLELINGYIKNENVDTPLPPPAVKPKKKTREDTRKLSLDLFLDGRSLAEIAVQRQLTETTIEEHLAYYVGTGTLELGKLVSPEISELIISNTDMNEELRATPVKEKLGDRVSWRELRFVMHHLRFINKDQKK